MKARATVTWGRFVWDAAKESANVARHGIDFRTAAQAFLDPDRLIRIDEKHSFYEPRWYCIGSTEDGIVTVRFTYRGGQVRMIGAGYWRQGRKLYETLKTSRS
jgi:uncharacterized DUF497 family protein